MHAWLGFLAFGTDMHGEGMFSNKFYIRSNGEMVHSEERGALYYFLGVLVREGLYNTFVP